MEKPVIAYASGGLEEILRLTGNQPFLAPVGEYSELSARVSRFLDEPDLIESVGRNNRIQIEACFGPEAYEANLQAMLNHIGGAAPSAVPVADLPSLRPVRSSPKTRRRAKKARLLPSARRRLQSIKSRKLVMNLKRLKRGRRGSEARVKRGARSIRSIRRVSHMRRRRKDKKRL